MPLGVTDYDQCMTEPPRNLDFTLVSTSTEGIVRNTN